MIQVNQISKSYRREPVLKEVSFTVGSGQTACIVGRNGSGKSTLLSIVAGRLLPDRGEIRICGELLNARHPQRIGYLSQTDGLLEDLTVAQNIAFWAAAAKVKKTQINSYVELLQLEPFWKKKIRTLSGGMRRRTAICAALLPDPDCLLLDEPFTGLDLIHKEELLTYLGRIREGGKTLLYTAHNVEEIGRLTDRLILLNGGSTTELPWVGSSAQMQQTIMRCLREPNHSLSGVELPNAPVPPEGE